MKSRVVMAAVFLFLGLGLVLAGCSKHEEQATAAPAQGEEGSQEQGSMGRAAPAPSAAHEIKSYKYVLETDLAGPQKTRMEYLVAPGKMDLKMSQQQAGGWKLMSHMIMNGKDLYVIPGTGNIAMKMEATDEQIQNMVPKDMMFVPDWNDYMKDHKLQGFTKQGRETVNGAECTRYQGSIGVANENIYVDDQGLVRRVEIPGDDNQPTRAMDIVEVQLNPSFSDADFLPPKGYSIHELPQMPGMPGGADR